MNSRILLAALGLFLHLGSQAQSAPAEMEAGSGFKLEKVLSLTGAQAFTWDDHGQGWVLSRSDHRLTVSTWSVPKTGVIRPLRSFQKLGNGRSTLLVSGNTFFVADGAVMRSFPAKERKSAGTVYVPPASLFPAQREISSLVWSPLGYIYFLYHSPASGENGIGRVNLQGTQWDVVAKGTFTNLAFDADGFLVTADAGGNSLFRVAAGLDYDRGLQTYQKSDLALKLDKADLQTSFATIYLGAGWPTENRGTWIVFDRARSTLEQFKEAPGGLTHWRTVARVDKQSTLRDLQVGPDGAAWLLVVPSPSSQGERPGAIFRLTTITAENQADTGRDISRLSNEELVAEFGNLNVWHRDAALRILDHREELRTARGLHPRTPLHDVFREKTNSPLARVYAVLSLHRLALLDETLLENAADDDEPLVRTWAGLLLGERNYPTGVAFQKLLKLAQDTNLVARSASAIAARQFVSGSLAVDTPPRAMPLREVFTGGILSTLWFSTKNGSTPEFDLLFWNAVRPITAYDPVHPMGFFNGDNDAKLALAYWIVGLITRQIAETEDRFMQEEAMIMVSELNPENPRMILAALRGLKNGTSNRKVKPTERSLQVLTDFANSKNPEIASLSAEIRREWREIRPARN